LEQAEKDRAEVVKASGERLNECELEWLRTFTEVKELLDEFFRGVGAAETSELPRAEGAAAHGAWLREELAGLCLVMGSGQDYGASTAALAVAHMLQRSGNEPAKEVLRGKDPPYPSVAEVKVAVGDAALRRFAQQLARKVSCSGAFLFLVFVAGVGGVFLSIGA
jgi:hypothetical protein